MERTTKYEISYSIIRYTPDELRGETINAGLIFYNYQNNQTKYFLLDEKSQKIKNILDNSIEVEIYKNYKSILEYYLNKSKDTLDGTVGGIRIASYFEELFLEKIYEEYQNKKMTLTKPNKAYTRDVEQLFNVILKRYIGEKNIVKEHTTMNAKSYMKKIFEENQLINTKIKLDMVLKPIEELNDFKIKVDFSFKKNQWNYMQTISANSNASKNIDWFAKTQLMVDKLDQSTSKIHLIYKKSEIKEDISIYTFLRYLEKRYSNVQILNLDKNQEVVNLCKYIKEECEDLEKIAVS